MNPSPDKPIFRTASALLAIFSGWLVFRFDLIRFDKPALSMVISILTAFCLVLIHLTLIVLSGRGKDRPAFNKDKFKTNLYPLFFSALREELVFRGVIMSGLTVFFGWINGIVFSSLIFAVIHAKEPGGEISFWFSLMLGIGLGLSVALTGDLIFPALAHAVLNLTTISIESRPRSV